MHEKALMDDVIRKLELLTAEEGGQRISLIHVRLGALSHFTPDHFREHFEDAARGTVAEGATVQADVDDDPTDERACGVVLESVELELCPRC